MAAFQNFLLKLLIMYMVICVSKYPNEIRGGAGEKLKYIKVSRDQKSIL